MVKVPLTDVCHGRANGLVPSMDVLRPALPARLTRHNRWFTIVQLILDRIRREVSQNETFGQRREPARYRLKSYSFGTHLKIIAIGCSG